MLSTSFVVCPNPPWLNEDATPDPPRANPGTQPTFWHWLYLRVHTFDGSQAVSGLIGPARTPHPSFLVQMAQLAQATSMCMCETFMHDPMRSNIVRICMHARTRALTWRTDWVRPVQTTTRCEVNVRRAASVPVSQAGSMQGARARALMQAQVHAHGFKRSNQPTSKAEACACAFDLHLRHSL